MDQKKLREALDHSLQLWGVNTNSREHNQFRKRIQKHGIDLTLPSGAYYDEEDLSFEDLRKQTFPNNIQDAYELCLATDLKMCSDFFSDFEDKLSINCYPEPYIRSGISSYRVREAFKGIHTRDLDPLHRFTFRKVPNQEFYYQDWFVDTNKDSEMGTFMEAWWTCHAIYNESCFHCNCRKSLRWKGGLGAAWMDLICIECKSIYELKTKATMEKIEAVYRHNNINSGSFADYCDIEHSKKNGHPKMFLVLLPRNFTYNRAHKKCYPVFISEIDEIKPRLWEESFRLGKEFISLKSQTSLKLNTKKRWFELPLAKKVNNYDTRKRVYIEHFGNDVYNKLSEQFSSVTKNEEPTPMMTKSPKQEDIAAKPMMIKSTKHEDIVASLANLKIHDDAEDWDNIYDSD